MKLRKEVVLGGRKLATTVSVAMAVVCAAVFTVSAEDLYFCPNADGKGATNWKDSSSNHGWYIGKSNWTNAHASPTKPRPTSSSAST